ncbi:PREDICTED: nuclear pore complex protein NUP214 isoform X2 [Lupinus angustifolius]|uniref:nuclear pore complex protein NUP214 isoform X2 n=1 Tax=Lupinus angustifolius TaxID=3871 RepID=UPI00092E2AEA|nr:PREDICTED: nuclear pore complex protein NUP214 isoform X2 [Lupinus angustifolius]
MGGASDPSNVPIINVEDELEGELVGTTDYFFSKIGETVPLKGNGSIFDLESLPSHPIALSQRLRLIFVAHTSGFFVVRTKDVIDSAKQFKDKGTGSSVEELSLVDVSIGRVHILALSTDNSLLAASVSGQVQFYLVDSFVNKEVKQSFSCSLSDDSAFVKDMRWITTSENSFVVLSNTGQLYYGEAGLPLKSVMDSVEAVDWSVKGEFVAVARKNNVLSILSAKKFEEWVSISLSFNSWIGDSDENRSVKVDSVKCIRPDSIVVGCFQLDEDGKEENYLVQVIRSKAGEITRGCSDFIVQLFCDMYQGLFDDIVPFGSGPYLLLSYIEQCQLAINANIKNTDQHIMLLGWSVDDDHKNEPVVVDIERDNLVPRIELQENGDDNLLLGLCVDTVSIYEQVGVQLGMGEEKTELTPYCVLICLTLEGRLVMFHVASQAGSEVSQPEVVSALCDGGDASIKPPADKGSTFSHESQKQELNQAPEESTSLKSKTLANPYQITNGEDFTKHREVESVASIQSLKSNVKQMVPDVDLTKETDRHNSFTSGEQQTNTGHKTVPLGSSTGSFSLNSNSAARGFSSYVNSQGTTEVTKVQHDTNSSRDTQRASHLFPGTTPVHNANDSHRTSHLFPGTTNVHNANDIQTTSHLFAGTTNVHTANVFGSVGGKSLLSHDVSGVSPATNSATRPVQRGGQLTPTGAAVNTQPVSHTSSPLLSDANSTAGKSSLRKFHPSNEQHGASSKLGISSSDLSKQFGNINEMTNELDLLLRSIEEAGGFRDACTRSLRSSIEAVEQGMGALSKNCKIQTCQVDEHLKEVQYLLNKTIQVVARKIYMEGIYMQASDSQYWDLWNRQKLNSELELKRQHILSLNQDLTYQLIELERHFNALELNKFSQNGGSRTGHGAFRSRYGPSKNIQSLHSLHNAISSQLVAAENLSECLSKQMSSLSLRSLSEKQKNVKELFETIGIPYDASFGTPDMKGSMRTSSSKNLLFSDFSANNDKCKKIQGSAMKNCESEMARRRRDSLDRSWTCFEPPKTTIKRKLLQQEFQKPNWNGSPFSVNKEKGRTSMLKESAPRQADVKFPSIVFPASNMNVGTLDSHFEHEEESEGSKLFLADDFLAPTQVSASKSHVSQRSNISAFPSWSASQSSPAMVHGHSIEAKDFNAEKLNVVQKFDSISNSENKSLHTKMPQNSSVSTYSNPGTPSPFKSSELPIKNSKMTMATSSMVGNKLPNVFTPESSRKHDFPTSELRSSTISSPLTLFGKTELIVDKIQPKANISAHPTFGGLFESPSFPAIKTSSAASPLSSSVSSATLPSTAVSVALSRDMTSSNTSIDLTSETLKSEIKPVAVSNLKTNLGAASEAVTQPNEPLNGKAELKLGSSGKPSPNHEKSSNNTTTSELNVVRDSQSEKPSDAQMQFSNSFIAPASVSSAKNGGLDFGIPDQDEMEEEAPETSNTTELNLGSLGGFGIGSTPNPSLPKSNPFGGSFSNVATSSSSPTISFSVPGGELFRPASFSFPSSQPSAPAQSTNSGAFSGGFGAGATIPASNPPSAFGQPSQIGSGQQVLGSVLGSFGQSRQLGGGLPGSGFAAPSGFGGGFAGSGSPTGFPSAATGGGFAGIASTGGGFAGIASAGGGFAAAASPSTGSGFSGISSAGGGFGGAAPTGGGFGALSSGGGGFAGAGSGGGGFAGAGSGGGGFGGFSNQQGNGGFSAFGATGGSKPPELFTQMRK